MLSCITYLSSSNCSPPARPPPKESDITIQLEQLCIDGQVGCTNTYPHTHMYCTMEKPPSL